jgi:hypothetical protein
MPTEGGMRRHSSWTSKGEGRRHVKVLWRSYTAAYTRNIPASARMSLAFFLASRVIRQTDAPDQPFVLRH